MDEWVDGKGILGRRCQVGVEGIASDNRDLSSNPSSSLIFCVNLGKSLKLAKPQ